MANLVTPKNDPIIGIDLGTTNSLVAIVQGGQPHVLNTTEGERLLPSVVSFEKGEMVLGYGARAKKVRQARNTVFSVKRLLGRSFEDLKGSNESLPFEVLEGEGDVRIKVGDRSYSAIEISALILAELKRGAEQSLGQPVKRAVVTVPAYFNDSQRQATRSAGRLAGLEVVRIINEPTAAALAYGYSGKNQGTIAVYDLGGGTFDVSILRIRDGIFEVLSTHGNTRLGGDDLDQAIIDRLAPEAPAGARPEVSIEKRAEWIEAAEKLKRSLSSETESSFQIDGFSRKVSRAEFETWVMPLLEKTRESCEAALKDAGLKASELTDVVLVGGPTRLGVVQKTVETIFGRKPNASMHPDEVVAAGAAIQADILAGNNLDLLLLDVVPLSLGIETYGGLMNVLIARNTRVPASAREVFTTYVDRQTGVDIHVFQGERERATENRSLAKFKLAGIEPLPAGLPRIEVMFLIDADGILQVSARDLKTGHEQAVEIKPSYGLTDEQVTQMLEAKNQHQGDDLAFKLWVETAQEAEPVLRSTEKHLQEAKRLLTEPEYERLNQALESLKSAMKAKNVEATRKASFELSRSSERLAELLMKEAITRG